MKTARKFDENLDIILNYFIITPAEELSEMPLKEFKIMINALPVTELYIGMSISLMDDLIRFEDYKKCIILRDYIAKYNK